ncbi:IS701 family transposase [Actinacidiphila sp. bgisy167]|uniref:IS701 family transposase n=1 Tax=Actinacidiphila sp. bgisy167 TaxID=3413797 RepID=UPI003D72A84E
MTALEASPLTLANGPAEFARCIFMPLPRSDQRRWAEVYLRGLLTIPGKKTIKKMIRVCGDNDVSRMTQSLQQFISQSTWDWYQVREAMARKLHASLDAEAWVVDQAVVPKRGTHSVGVAKRFVAAQGRTFNCQVGIGLFLATDIGSLPVDWSLALDDTWSLNDERRSRAKIPGDVAGKPDSQLILDMVDRAVHDWGLPALPVVAGLCNCPDAYSLLAGLQERGTSLVLEVPASLEVLPAFPANAKPAAKAAEADGARLPTARELVSGGTSRPHVTSVPHDTDQAQRVFLRSCLVQVPGLRTRPHLSLATFRLYAEWSPTESQATRFWITNLLDRRPDEIMRLAAMRQESATDLDRMEKSFGVKDFEGRSFPGWHRHMTMASAAYAFDRLKAAGRLMACAPSF